jgi:oligopeptide/dipeptide ABC transporter ATP-binding protein
MTSETPLLAVHDLEKRFPLGGGTLSKPRAWVRAVDGVSFSVNRGESFGLVGESGCGKTTLGHLVLRLIEPSAGRIEFDGQDLTRMNRTRMRFLRQRMQIIFQDPYSSLDPRMKVDAIVTEPLRAIHPITKTKRREAAAEFLARVGLSTTDLGKYPHEFSGGQRQRIGIARALSVRPDLIVADEPVSALDVSIQAQVINLMEDLREAFNLAYIFISHDLSVVGHICDRIAVMYLGAIFELAASDNLSLAARHPYTRALLTAVPQPDPHRRVKPLSMEEDVPNPVAPPSGCTFHPRCPFAFDPCRLKRPPLVEPAPNHYVACWLNEGRGVEGERK